MWQALIAVIMAVVVPAGIKMLKGLGFGFATFTGLNVLLDYVEQNIFTSMESLPSKVFQLAVMCGVDQYFVIVLSALTISFAFSSFGGTSIKRLGASAT